MEIQILTTENFVNINRKLTLTVCFLMNCCDGNRRSIPIHIPFPQVSFVNSYFFSFSSRMGIPQRKLTFIPKRVRIFRYVYLDRTSTSSEWYLLLQYNLYNPENRITSNNRPP